MGILKCGFVALVVVLLYAVVKKNWITSLP